ENLVEEVADRAVARAGDADAVTALYQVQDGEGAGERFAGAGWALDRETGGIENRDDASCGVCGGVIGVAESGSGRKTGRQVEEVAVDEGFRELRNDCIQSQASDRFGVVE